MARGRALGTLRAALGLRHQLGRVLVARDLHTFVRLEALGALARSGLAEALRTPGDAATLAARAGLTDVELTRALLDVGVATRHLRHRGSTYRLRGARMKAVAGGRAPDVAGLAEEATSYDGPIYASLDRHLRGEPPAPYLDGLGDVIARASRLAEPVAGPWIAAQARAARPSRVLDVGCGSGVNLRWLAKALPDAVLQGIDLEADAIEGAKDNLAAWGLDGRVAVERADLRDLPASLGGPWDLVLLAQNIYYWPVEQRAGVLRTVRDLTGGSGTVLALSAIPTRAAVGRNLDLVMRVTTGCYRLPTIDELRSDATAAGFAEVRVRDLIPGAGMAGLVARG